MEYEEAISNSSYRKVCLIDVKMNMEDVEEKAQAAIATQEPFGI